MSVTSAYIEYRTGKWYHSIKLSERSIDVGLFAKITASGL